MLSMVPGQVRLAEVDLCGWSSKHFAETDSVSLLEAALEYLEETSSLSAVVAGSTSFVL